MRVLRVRNAHQALSFAAELINEVGYWRDSRNGRVIMSDQPVTTVYMQPKERVIFWPGRDANPFFHLYESLWMLMGRHDLASVQKYAQQMAEYSDNGQTFHGAYGWRWKTHFGVNQLQKIARRLIVDPNDRRCVLQMWDPVYDLDKDSKDLPCNVTATFQRDRDGRLNLVVFNRSNDIIWGCYGANAVHFSMLLEYMAVLINCPVGDYTQVSVNWHMYEATQSLISEVPHGMSLILNSPRTTGWKFPDPYERGEVRVIPMPEEVPELIPVLFHEEENNFNRQIKLDGEWAHMVYAMLKAHFHWRTLPAPERYNAALGELSRLEVPQDADWVVAGKQWLQRRKDKWQSKMDGLKEG